MNFEDSPELGSAPKPRKPGFGDWILGKQRTILLLAIGVLVGVLGAVVLMTAQSRAQATNVGGLDGCVKGEDGGPMTAEIQIAGQLRGTSSDGCFFFEAVPAGEQRVRVVASDGGVWEGTVEILKGEAVGLGDILIQP